MIIIADIIFHY